MPNLLPPPTKKLVLRKTEIKTPPLSTATRVELGQLLRSLLAGEMLSLPQSRPLPSVAAHVHELRVNELRVNELRVNELRVNELRVNDQDQTWRLIYRIDPDAIVVVELFSKKTPQTPQAVIERCQARLKTYDADQQTLATKYPKENAS